MDLNRKIKESCGGLLVRLFHGACPRKNNALPSHPLCSQLHLDDDSLLSSDDNLAVLLIAFWVLEVTFQANTSFGVSGGQAE